MAVFIATVAIFSERSVTELVKNQSVPSKEEASSQFVEDESVTDQKNETVSETTKTGGQIEDDVENQKAEIITKKSLAINLGMVLVLAFRVSTRYSTFCWVLGLVDG